MIDRSTSGSHAAQARREIRLLRALLLLLACAPACGGAQRTPPTDALAARFALVDAERARALAPDLYAQAERARQDARSAQAPAAQQDLNASAQWLLDAAVAEADRIASERERAATDARAEHALEQRADLERQRLDLDRSSARELAAKTARAADAGTNTARDGDAGLLCDRAALTLATAIARGFDAGRADALERAIDDARRVPSGTARVLAARRALERAQHALSETRAQ